MLIEVHHIEHDASHTAYLKNLDFLCFRTLLGIFHW